MANTFKNYTGSNIGTPNTTVYTVPAATTSVVIGINLANIHTSQINVDVQLAGVHLIKNIPIPAGSSLSPLDGKIILEAGDLVIVSSSAVASMDVIVSVLEQS